MELAEIRARQLVEEENAAKRKRAVFMALITPILFVSAYLIVNKNLPKWVGFDPNHPLGPILTWGTTILGGVAIYFYIRLLMQKKLTGASAPVAGVGLATVLVLVNCLFLLVAAKRWHGAW